MKLKHEYTQMQPEIAQNFYRSVILNDCFCHLPKVETKIKDLSMNHEAGGGVISEVPVIWAG